MVVNIGAVVAAMIFLSLSAVMFGWRSQIWQFLRGAMVAVQGSFGRRVSRLAGSASILVVAVFLLVLAFLALTQATGSLDNLGRPLPGKALLYGLGVVLYVAGWLSTALTQLITRRLTLQFSFSRARALWVVVVPSAVLLITGAAIIIAAAVS